MSGRIIGIEGQDQILEELKRIGNISLFDATVKKQAFDVERKLKQATFVGKSTKTKRKIYITDVEGMNAEKTTLSGTGHLKRSWFSVKLDTAKWAVFNAIQVGNAKWILAEILNWNGHAKTAIGYRWKNFIDDLMHESEQNFENAIMSKISEVTS